MNTLPRVLVVDDAPDTQLLAKKALENRFEIVSAGSLGDADIHLSKGTVDLVILDVSLPDGDGIEFCRSLSKDPAHGGTPIILLTNRTDVSDKLAGFEAGADDYIVKPFHPSELEARSIIRLKTRTQRQEAPSGDVVSVGDLTFDLKSQTAKVSTPSGGTSKLPLTHQEFKLLLCLARESGRILSREEIVKEVWDHDLRVTARTVDTHICKLRKKIAASPSRFAVQAVYGAGYRFIEPSLYYSRGGAATSSALPKN